MSRYPDKEMMKSWKHFDTSVKLCKQAHTTGKIARFKNLLETLQTTYYKFEEDFELYKEDTIKKTCKTEGAFNAIVSEEGVEKPAFTNNDEWSDQQMMKYVDTRDLLQDTLDDLDNGSVETKVTTKDNVNLVVEEFKAECETVESSISKLKSEIEGQDEQGMAANLVMSYENIISKLQTRISVDIKEKVASKLALGEVAQNAEYTDDKIIAKFGAFSQKQSTELYSCSMLLVRKSMPKVEEAKPFLGIESSTSSGGRPREQVFLEKTKPPKFNGDDPEFKRKWQSQVNKANLPEETELDKLRDVIPKDAKDQLYGITKLDEAWSILTKRFGDKNLISKKLKNQLKNIQCDGKNDPEKVINLKIKVRNIVIRLESLDMGAALTHDSEFLSAVYCSLPDRHKVRWLDTLKTGDHWADMMIFLDKTYDQANEELALLAVMTKEDSSKTCVKAFGVSAGTSGAGDWADNNPGETFRQRAKEACGKCPVCNQFHTWTKKDGTFWPSDRLISCKKFSDMNIQQRASAVESASGCPRCTCWRHQRKDCRMSPNSCGEVIGASKCTGDHSRLLHASGNVYCAALTADLDSSISSSDLFSCVKEDEDTLYYMQDIPIKKSAKPARVLWDKGSNRVLIRDEFAKATKLVSKEVTYNMETWVIRGPSSSTAIYTCWTWLTCTTMSGQCGAMVSPR